MVTKADKSHKTTKPYKVAEVSNTHKAPAKLTLDSALAELSRSIEEKEKAGKELTAEKARKEESFVNDFKGLLIHTINPALITIVEKFNKAGNIARICNKEDEKLFSIGTRYTVGMYVSCYVKIKDGINSFTLSVAGSRVDLKVSIVFNFFNNKQVKKEFELSEITPELIEQEVANQLAEIIVT